MRQNASPCQPCIYARDGNNLAYLREARSCYHQPVIDSFVISGQLFRRTTRAYIHRPGKHTISAWMFETVCPECGRVFAIKNVGTLISRYAFPRRCPDCRKAARSPAGGYGRVTVRMTDAILPPTPSPAPSRYQIPRGSPSLDRLAASQAVAQTQAAREGVPKGKPRVASSRPVMSDG